MKLLVECTAGSAEKGLYDPATFERVGVRTLVAPYPFPYGFVPGTRADDGDCVDGYLITRTPVAAGALVDCEPIGLLEQLEGDEVDHKVLAALPGEAVDLAAAEAILRDFIVAIFAPFPAARLRLGRLLPREAAEAHLAASRA